MRQKSENETRIIYYLSFPYCHNQRKLKILLSPGKLNLLKFFWFLIIRYPFPMIRRLSNITLFFIERGITDHD
jgi:hypothetical protein